MKPFFPGTIDTVQEPELGEWDWWDELRRQIDGDYSSQFQTQGPVVPRILALLLLIVWLANISFWLWRCSSRYFKMRTPARTGHRRYLVKNTTSSSSAKHNKNSTSEYTAKNSISTLHRSSKTKGLKESIIKDIERVTELVDSAPKLSKSKSDYCIRYGSKEANSSPKQVDDEKLKPIKMARTASDGYEKNQKKIVIMERMPGDSGPASYCDCCKSRLPVIQKEMTTGRVPNDTLHLAPPPSGYFIRDDVSTEESYFDKKKVCCHHHVDSKPNIAHCTFGYNSWSKAKDDDRFAEHKLPVGIDVIECRKPQSPRIKKRRSNTSSKESPRSKSKKTKKRKTTRKSVEYKDQSPKKTKVDDCTRNQSKKSFDLKTGIALRHFSRNERSHPIRYQQKILDPNNSKFFQTMGSLPVSMDSVLYYYEPQGKSKSKRNTSQNRNVEKTYKGRGNSGHDRQDAKGLSWMKISDKRGTVYLNTNGNAYDSENDMTEDEEVSPVVEKPETFVSLIHPDNPFIEITGKAEALQAQPPLDFNNMANQDPVDGKEYAFYSDSLEVASIINKPMGEMCPLLASLESNNTQYGLDLMVDEIFESAVKEEQYERCLVENPSDKPAGETGQVKGKTTKSATFSINLENNMMSDSPKKHIEKDDENTKEPVSKHASTRPDLVKMCKALKRVSSSSPNLSMARKGDRTLGGKQPSNSGESPSRSKSTPQTNKFSSPSHGLRSLEHSPYTKSPQTQTPPAGKTTYKWSNMHGAIKKAACENAIEENCAENLQERGRPKQVREEPVYGSILRKSKSVPQGEKRTQSHPIKSIRKRKPIPNLKKSQSMSPNPSKASCPTGINSGTPTQQSGQLSSESPRKKCQTLTKKNKKKVRIVVDWNSFSTGATANASPRDKDIGSPTYCCEEKHSKASSDVDVDGDSSCDLVYNVEIESRENHQLERIEQNNDEELEKETKVEADNEEAEERMDEEEPCKIMCGFSEGMKEEKAQMQPMSVNFKDVSIDHKSKVKKVTKVRKVIKSKEDKTSAERGWDSNFVKKDDPKLKRKRYQLKKTVEHVPEKTKTAKHHTPKEHIERDQSEDRDFDTPVDYDKLSTKMKKLTSPQVCKAPKSAQVKRPYVSPTGLRRKVVDLDPRGEGSSVDAPAFNARRESVVRLSKSSTLANMVKPNAKEGQGNAPKQRVKQARENFARLNRKGPNPSPKIGQVSPQASRSTDLDIACLKKQVSPARGAAAMALKPARTESKLSASKPRPKSESECGMSLKEDIAEGSVTESPPRSPLLLDHNFSDPVEMSVLNLGLHWVAQRIMKRLSFFQSKPENEEEIPISPVFDNISIVENENI